MHFPTYDLITVIDEQLRITRQADRNAHVIAELPDTSDDCRKRCSGSKLNFHSPFSDTHWGRVRAEGEDKPFQPSQSPAGAPGF
jgi:hypothetical protein